MRIVYAMCTAEIKRFSFILKGFHTHTHGVFYFYFLRCRCCDGLMWLFFFFRFAYCVFQFIWTFCEAEGDFEFDFARAQPFNLSRSRSLCLPRRHCSSLSLTSSHSIRCNSIEKLSACRRLLRHTHCSVAHRVLCARDEFAFVLVLVRSYSYS